MSGVKRKCNSKSIAEKCYAIKQVENGISRSKVAAELGVPHNTLSGWIKQKDKLMTAHESKHFEKGRKKLRLSNFPKVDEATFRWYKQERTKNLPVSGPTIQAKAKSFANLLKVENFNASDGWLAGFKSRHGLAFKSDCVESNAVDNAVVDDWYNTEFKQILKDYEPRNIFNCDETGIFFKLLPNMTQTHKGEFCHRGEKSKGRITTLVCANMDGSEKLPLFVIGKAAKPRCFQNVKSLPTDYETNSKAWMTGELFTNWVKKLDEKLKAQSRNICLILDNCTAHPIIPALQAIKLHFLPPNMKSNTQPMDQGIIHNMKLHFRKHVLMAHMETQEINKDFTIDLLFALRSLQKGWNDVKAETIVKCFCRRAFTDVVMPVTSESVNEDNDLDVPEEYVHVDDNLATCEEYTDTSIVTDILVKQQPEDASVVDDNKEKKDSQNPTRNTPTSGEARVACDILRRFFESYPGMNAMFDNIADLEKQVNKLCPKKFKQLTLQDVSQNT